MQPRDVPRQVGSARPLAVLTPEIGLPSETFIHWDIHYLLPAGTVAVTDPPPEGQSVHGHTTWRCEQPLLAFPPVPGDPPPSPTRTAAVGDFLTAHGVRVVLVEYLDFAARWIDTLRKLDVRIWLRGQGVDLSARLREPSWPDAYRGYGGVAGLLLPSRAAADRLVRLGLPAALLHVVPYGVAIPPTRRNAISGVVRCVAVGRMVPKKAPLLVLEAFRRAHTRLPDLRLEMIGDGPLMPAVQRYVRDHQLTHVIRLHGTLPHGQTLQVLRQCQVLLHHAVTGPDGDAEGLPVAVLEAMAAGLAVIATAHEGIPEAVRDRVTGLLVAEHDTVAMADALLRLAALPAEVSRLGDAAREAARLHHDEHHVRARCLTLFDVADAATGVCG